MIELLLSEELDSDSGKAMLKEVEQKTGRLIVFLNDILTWAEKQQKGKSLPKQIAILLSCVTSCKMRLNSPQEVEEYTLVPKKWVPKSSKTKTGSKGF